MQVNLAFRPALVLERSVGFRSVDHFDPLAIGADIIDI
jgi:hypothetical protein